MYFLYQLKFLFSQVITLKGGDGSHALDDLAAPAPANDNTAPELQEDFTQDQISAMSSSEVLQELKERLDIVKAGEKIVGTRADVLMRFCLKVKNNEVHGYTTADADYKRLVEMVQAAVIEYRGLAGEAAQIDDTIRRELDRITLGINKEIDNPEGNSVTLDETEKENQEKMEDLERERDSYSGIFNEQLSEFTSEQQGEFSEDGKAFIEKISELLQYIPEGNNFEDRLLNFQKNNGVLKGKIEELGTYLELERELITAKAYSKRLEDFKSSLPEGESVDQEKEQKFNELILTQVNGTITEKLEQVKSINEQLLAILNDINPRENTSQLFSRELSVEEKTELGELQKEYEDKRIKIGEKLSGYLSSENIPEPYLSLVNDYNLLKVDFSNMTDSQEYDELKTKIIPQLAELDFKVDVTLRDELIIGDNGERLGDVRKSLVEKKYEELKNGDNEELKEFLKDKDYKDLNHSDFSILAERFDINLAEFMIIGENGKLFDGTYRDGEKYIFNSGENTHAGEYVLAYIFDIEHIESIELRGITYTRSTEVGKLFKDSEGNPIGTPRDGELITVGKVESLTEETRQPYVDARTQTHRGERAQSIIRNAVGNVDTTEELNGFKWGAFWEALKNGDIDTFIKQLEHLLNLEFHYDQESGELSMSDPNFSNENYVINPEILNSITSVSADIPASYQRNFMRTAEAAGMSGEQFLGAVKQECDRASFPVQRYIALVGHESGWRYDIKNPTSSAYGLGQMIDSTWASYANGGNRRNPIDQMKASLGYLTHIRNYRQCSPEDACAFYNTGEGFRVDNGPAPSSYVNTNGVIVNKIPRELQANGITRREYFIGAVAYYNDISYAEARSSSKFG